MSKALRFISYFDHERSWSSLKLENISEIEKLDYTEINLYRMYQNCYLSKEEKNTFFAT